MEEHRLDGNAAAGVLREIFAFEATTAEYACETCGRSGVFGGAMVYVVREMGIIVRCPGCESAIMRVTQNQGRNFVDLKGMRHLVSG